MNEARRFAARVIAVTLAFAIAFGVFDFIVDPFDQYRLPSWYTPRYFRFYQRHQLPGLAKHAVYDRVVTGSSLMENVVSSDVDRLLGGRTINLACGALSAYESRLLLETAFDARRIDDVILNLDFNAFSGSTTQRFLTEPMPAYLYDDNPLNDVPYLLGATTLARSLEIVFGLKSAAARSDSDRPWYWADQYEFSARAATRGLDPANLNRDFKQAPRTLEGMQASFEANVLPLVKAHPETRFDFLFAPYSILVWADFRQRGQLEVSLGFRRYVANALAPYPNARVFDFQDDEAVITDLSLYKDIYHYKPEISNAMIRAISRDESRLTPRNADARNATIQELAEATDAAGIISAAQRSAARQP
jgi:hypothetical protein